MVAPVPAPVVLLLLRKLLFPVLVVMAVVDVRSAAPAPPLPRPGEETITGTAAGIPDVGTLTPTVVVEAGRWGRTPMMNPTRAAFFFAGDVVIVGDPTKGSSCVRRVSCLCSWRVVTAVAVAVSVSLLLVVVLVGVVGDSGAASGRSRVNGLYYFPVSAEGPAVSTEPRGRRSDGVDDDSAT